MESIYDFPVQPQHQHSRTRNGAKPFEAWQDQGSGFLRVQGFKGLRVSLSSGWVEHERLK